jgi:hypothetical protein
MFLRCGVADPKIAVSTQETARDGPGIFLLPDPAARPPARTDEIALGYAKRA